MKIKQQSLRGYVEIIEHGGHVIHMTYDHQFVGVLPESFTLEPILVDGRYLFPCIVDQEITAKNAQDSLTVRYER